MLMISTTFTIWQKNTAQEVQYITCLTDMQSAQLYRAKKNRHLPKLMFLKIYRV